MSGGSCMSPGKIVRAASLVVRNHESYAGTTKVITKISYILSI